VRELEIATAPQALREPLTADIPLQEPRGHISPLALHPQVLFRAWMTTQQDHAVFCMLNSTCAILVQSLQAPTTKSPNPPNVLCYVLRTLHSKLQEKRAKGTPMGHGSPMLANYAKLQHGTPAVYVEIRGVVEAR
jgi:hypothetical protein